jgi:hypothetical protein
LGSYNPAFPGKAAWAEFSSPFFLLDRLSTERPERFLAVADMF